MCWEDQGQFTGEISPVMLKEVGVSVVEIGHSERRHVFREDDFDQEKKTAKAARSGFTPLLCIGETLTQREYDLSGETLSTQLKVGLHSITGEQASQPTVIMWLRAMQASAKFCASALARNRETAFPFFTAAA